MIHGIYLKNKPKAKWHLFSLATSAETASNDYKRALELAHKEGNENAEVAIQVFDTIFWIPETINDLKDQKPIYN